MSIHIALPLSSRTDCARRSAFAGVILRAVYGIDISEAETNKATEEVVDIVKTVMDAFRTASVPGAFLIEFMPALRYVPAWFPGAGFQTRLANWRAAADKMVELPYEKAKAAAAIVSPRGEYPKSL